MKEQEKATYHGRIGLNAQAKVQAVYPKKQAQATGVTKGGDLRTRPAER